MSFCEKGQTDGGERKVMSILVQKYGGTSVGSIERIEKVAERIVQTKASGHQCVVIVSAMGKQTDELINLANQITDQPTSRELDMLLTTGEQVTIALLTMALQKRGCSARSLTGWQAGIQTDPVHGKASVEHVDTTRLRACLEKDEVVVVAGFQGISESGEITTLGRGGSDTSAVILAAALRAEACEIYTDVPGVYTADPRIVPQARKMDEISYEEMLELAHLGAGILHPRAVECAMIHKVPLTVRSSFVEESGTSMREAKEMEKTLAARGVAHDVQVARIKVLHLPNRKESIPRLFSLLADHHINVDMIVQSEHDQEKIDISFSVSESEGLEAKQVIEQAKDELQFAEILYETDLAKVSLVGMGMMTKPGVAAKMFSALSDQGIRVKMVSTSEIKISCLIEREFVKEAVQVLHAAFDLDVKSEEVSMTT